MSLQNVKELNFFWKGQEKRPYPREGRGQKGLEILKKAKRVRNSEKGKKVSLGSK